MLNFHLRKETMECPQAFTDSMPLSHPARLDSYKMPPQTFINSWNVYYHLSHGDTVPLIVRQLPSVEIVAIRGKKQGPWLGRDHYLQQEKTVLFIEHLVHSWHYTKCSPMCAFNPNWHHGPDQPLWLFCWFELLVLKKHTTSHFVHLSTLMDTQIEPYSSQLLSHTNTEDSTRLIKPPGSEMRCVLDMKVRDAKLPSRRKALSLWVFTYTDNGNKILHPGNISYSYKHLQVHLLLHLTLTITVWRKYCYKLHFIHERIAPLSS